MFAFASSIYKYNGINVEETYFYLKTDKFAVKISYILDFKENNLKTPINNILFFLKFINIPAVLRKISRYLQNELAP